MYLLPVKTEMHFGAGRKENSRNNQLHVITIIADVRKFLCRLKRQNIGITFVSGGSIGSVVVVVWISLSGAKLCHCRSKSFKLGMHVSSNDSKCSSQEP